MFFIWLYFVCFIAGSPFLGATETVKATLSGVTFGLPVSEVFFSSFGTSCYTSL